MTLYRHFATQEELDAEYNPAVTARDADACIAGWARRSAGVIEALKPRLGLKFGPTREEYCDVYPAGPDSPVHLFVHGGYWRRFSARDHAFLAPALVEAGITAVIMNYALCPRVTLDEIVRQTRAAVAWTHAHAADFGADPSRFTISGHSAGGHLVAMALATDWPGDYGLPADIIKAAMPISGVFDLDPIPYTFVQPKVQITWDQARRLSPQRRLPASPMPLVVAVGGLESAEFRRQSRDWHEACRANGHASTFVEVPDEDHFTVLEQLERPGSELHRALVGMATRR